MIDLGWSVYCKTVTKLRTSGGGGGEWGGVDLFVNFCSEFKTDKIPKSHMQWQWLIVTTILMAIPDPKGVGKSTLT